MACGRVGHPGEAISTFAANDESAAAALINMLDLHSSQFYMGTEFRESSVRSFPKYLGFCPFDLFVKHRGDRKNACEIPIRFVILADR
jgi:hypothetical protein